ncbi:MAG TPA: hypothetical protein VE011_09745 [Candidatus Dormibacteraeota bacterium]|nr:hypothetical protein [Candidatus Dormibacteraeota bacterium]
MAGLTPAPRGLGARGRRLWRRLVADFDFSVPELELLAEACRTLDSIDFIATALAGAELAIPGSRGQLTAHPLLAEQRQQRELLGRLIGRLQLPDEDPDDASAAATRFARRGAQARWYGPRRR